MSEERPETPGESPQHDQLIELTSGIVSAYVSNNATSGTDLPELIATVYGTLSTLGAAPPEPRQEPAVPVKRSVSKKAITCLECGKAQKILKRHLTTAHDLTPEEYRAKWGLASTYPMVAPDYAETRRALAKKIGLGRKPGTSAPKSKGKTARKKAG